jgi:hypothetical protein
MLSIIGCQNACLPHACFQNDEAAAAKAIAKAEYRIKHLVRSLNAKDADIANLKKENFKNEYRIKFILRALERAEAK